MIDILLATYNSSIYLADTIESILQQDFTQWRLLIRDGGSEDNTLNIIEKYIQLYSEKIIKVPFSGRACACANFSALLSESSAPYVMFCDHDDIWLPSKISRSFALMQQQQHTGAEEPMMVFTNKCVVDDELSVISESYFKYQNLIPENIQFNHLLVQNVPSGCTMLINRALADLCGPIPPQAVMYDHWISLTAAAFGRIIYLNEPTILYRQHKKNVFGASEYGWRYFLGRFLKGLSTVRNRFYQNVEQAAAFYDRFAVRVPPEHKKIVQEFSRLKELPWINRRRVLLRNRILKTGVRRNLGMLLIV